MQEIVRCPRCRTLTHPECLTYVTQTGEIVGCASCLPAKAEMGSQRVSPARRPLYIAALGTQEILACPHCATDTHPESLVWLTRTGEVVGCASCLPPAPAGQRRHYVLPAA